MGREINIPRPGSQLRAFVVMPGAAEPRPFEFLNTLTPITLLQRLGLSETTHTLFMRESTGGGARRITGALEFWFWGVWDADVLTVVEKSPAERAEYSEIEALCTALDARDRAYSGRKCAAGCA